MTIQILHYEFLGPIKISEWGPPMDKVVYIIFNQNKSGFIPLYAGESEKTDQKDFFTQNDSFKCWIQHAGSEEQLYLSILPLWESEEAERKRIEAQGVRDAQLIIKEGITDENIKWKSLEVLKEISMSPNAKLILTDGKTPVLINGDDK